jgi:predicted dinucleotide-binding enzyme
MAGVKRILLQLDCDPQPSTFDAVVAVDAGVDVLLRHGGVTPENVVSLVHGAMFTRGGRDLASTAIFVGGSDVAAAEAVAAVIRGTFFGPVRVGVLVDPSGANTTAAAAVLAAGRHLPLSIDARPRCRALVLGGTGPVGQRVARLLGGRGAAVAVASRHGGRAEETVKRLAAAVPAGEFLPVQWTASSGAGGPGRMLAETDLIVAAGAAGAKLLDAEGRRLAAAVKVLVDLNAVPPAGIEGVLTTDRGREQGGAVAYGALGVGTLKMRIHRAAIERIFSDTSVSLDAEDLLAIGAGLSG